MLFRSIVRQLEFCPREAAAAGAGRVRLEPGRPFRVDQRIGEERFLAALHELKAPRPVGVRGEESIATLCRKEGLAPNLYYRWSKEFLEAGKKRLVGDTTREATSTEVGDLRKENNRLKQLVAEMVLENRLLKKSVTAVDSDDEASA